MIWKTRAGIPDASSTAATEPERVVQCPGSPPSWRRNEATGLKPVSTNSWDGFPSGEWEAIPSLMS